jgi:hypothetical protein
MKRPRPTASLPQQRTRNLVIVNDRDEAVTLFLRWYAPDTAGVWDWRGDAGGFAVYQLPPHTRARLTDDAGPIHASQVQFFWIGGGGSDSKYHKQPYILVNRPYRAAAPEDALIELKVHRPVRRKSLRDPVLGPLTWETSCWRFSFQVSPGREVRGALFLPVDTPGRSGLPPSAEQLAQLRGLVAALRTQDRAIRRAVARERVGGRRGGRHTPLAVQRRLRLTDVKVYSDRTAGLVFDDGGALGGRAVSVLVGMDGRITGGPLLHTEARPLPRHGDRVGMIVQLALAPEYGHDDGMGDCEGLLDALWNFLGDHPGSDSGSRSTNLNFWDIPPERWDETLRFALTELRQRGLLKRATVVRSDYTVRPGSEGEDDEWEWGPETVVWPADFRGEFKPWPEFPSF